MLKSRKTDREGCDSMVERSESFNAARIVGEPQAATGLNEFTSEGSGWRRMPKPRKGRRASPAYRVLRCKTRQ